MPTLFDAGTSAIGQTQNPHIGAPLFVKCRLGWLDKSSMFHPPIIFLHA